MPRNCKDAFLEPHPKGGCPTAHLWALNDDIESLFRSVIKGPFKANVDASSDERIKRNFPLYQKDEYCYYCFFKELYLDCKMRKERQAAEETLKTHADILKQTEEARELLEKEKEAERETKKKAKEAEREAKQKAKELERKAKQTELELKKAEQQIQKIVKKTTGSSDTISYA